MNRADESETVRQIIVAVQKATPKPGDLIILNYDASAVDDSAAHEMNRRISEWPRDLLPGVLLLIFPNTVQARVDTLEHAIADLTARYESANAQSEADRTVFTLPLSDGVVATFCYPIKRIHGEECYQLDEHTFITKGDFERQLRNYAFRKASALEATDGH